MFWYNLSPKTGQKVDSGPQNAIFKCEWQHLRNVLPATEQETTERIGDGVWVKPPNGRCTTQWGRGVVTEVNSRNNVSIDGLPRQILNIRPVNAIDEEEKPSDDETPRRSLREIRLPVWNGTKTIL